MFMYVYPSDGKCIVKTPFTGLSLRIKRPGENLHNNLNKTEVSP